MSTSEKPFDFVIVGGGTAGLVIANRLTEDPSVQVLILEAGVNRNLDPNVQIPAYFRHTYGHPDYDWCYSTVPQQSLNGRVVPYPRGKGTMPHRQEQITVDLTCVNSSRRI